MMSYTIQEEKTYPHNKERIIQAILGAVNGLEGKVIKNETETGLITAKFNKTILGNVLGDRTQLEIEIFNLSPKETKLSLTVYPINPIGQKLEFGARKGISRKIMTWFLAHMDHQLKAG
jgi:hypothetical protein